MEMLLQDNFDIGAQSVNMDRTAYSPDLLDIVTNLFFHVKKDIAMLDDEERRS